MQRRSHDSSFPGKSTPSTSNSRGVRSSPGPRVARVRKPARRAKPRSLEAAYSNRSRRPAVSSVASASANSAEERSAQTTGYPRRPIVGRLEGVSWQIELRRRGRERQSGRPTRTRTSTTREVDAAASASRFALSSSQTCQGQRVRRDVLCSR